MKARLQADLLEPDNGFASQPLAEDGIAGIYVGLRGTGADNCVFLSVNHGLVYDKRAGLDQGHMSVAAPAWKEPTIGDLGFRVNERRQSVPSPPVAR